MPAPRIAVTFESPEKLGPVVEALTYVGASIDLLPVQTVTEHLLDKADGLLLTGGPDISPSFYGRPRHPATDIPDVARDEFEMKLLAIAQARGLPTLGICRGMQIMNVFFGGTLNQHIPHAERHHHRYGATDYLAIHPVTFEAPSKLGECVAETTIVVNSRHHQAIEEVGAGLVVVAKSDDGIIEAVEHRGHPFMMGVQWHPEGRVNTCRSDRRIVQSLVSAC